MSQIKPILSGILQEIKKMNRNDDDLWTRANIAEYLQCSPNQADRVIRHKDFPAAIRPPTSENGGHPRWVAREVKKFVQQFREVKS